MNKLPILVMALWSTLSLADFNTALQDYQDKNYQAAYQEFYNLAQIGEKRSQFNLAVMYFKGEHVEKDINKAYAWSQLATSNDVLPESNRNIAKIIAKKVIDQEAADAELERLNKKYSDSVLAGSLFPTLVAVEKSNSFQTTPVKTTPPEYPRKALYRGISGHVKVQFDIDPLGKVRNARIVESLPEKIFDKVSLRALNKWSFEAPRDINGDPKFHYNKSYTISFNLDGTPSVTETPFFKEQLQKANQGDPSSLFVIGKIASSFLGSENSLNINPTEFYARSAFQGLSIAQYHLGKSLVNGQGCVTDKSKGIAWLTRAASNGHEDATDYLISLALQDNTLESQTLALSFIKNDQAIVSHVAVRLAEMLATTPYQQIADPKRALALLENINKKNFRDQVTIQELKAAAYARLGDFDEAVDYQEDALDDAEDRDLYLEIIKQRLADYKKGINPFVENKTS